MAIRRVNAVWHHVSLLPSEVYVNTFHFQKAVAFAEPADSDTIDTALRSFYNEVHAPGTSAISGMFGSDVSRLEGELVHYNLTVGGPGAGDDTSGSPIRTSPILADAAFLADDLPQEVAVCLSYHADLTTVVEEVPGGAPGPAGDTRPRARRRGRIFVGPFNAQAWQGSTGLPKTELINDLVGAGDYLAEGVGLPVGVKWVVYSRVDGVARDVVGGWVDNAWDTQRRRGLGASVRTPFSV